MAKSPTHRLSRPVQFIWLGANAVFGLVPSLLFFAWIERNLALPVIPIELGWPWAFLGFYTLPPLILWNASLVLLFGIIHSLLAQPPAHRALSWILPPQVIRSFYVIVTGVTLTLLMGFWQHTGLILWRLPAPTWLNHALSFLVYWGFLLAAARVAARFDAFEFVGLRQLFQSRTELQRTSGTPTLLTSGIYARVRHPIYTFTLAAFLITPVMSVDRMILFAAVSFYLIAAIPVEEKKLVSEFGEAYLRYREKVPSVIPGLKLRRSVAETTGGRA